jgi:hypothetical protein
VCGRDFDGIAALDAALIQLDGTQNVSRLGPNPGRFTEARGSAIPKRSGPSSALSKRLFRAVSTKTLSPALSARRMW